MQSGPTSSSPDEPRRVPSSRLTWVDSGRGIAIVLVALYHSASWLLGAGFPIDTWRQINEALSALRMPLFFVLAGLFAAKWLVSSWGDLWRSKIRLFAWVFIVWEAIGSVVYMIGLRMKGNGIDVLGAARDLLLSPFAPRFELWFIWALALFFIVAKLLRRVDWRIQLAVAGLASAIALSGWETANVGWSGSIKYFFFFLAGLYLRQTILSIGRMRIGPVAILAVATWVGLSTVIAIFSLRWVPGLYFVDCLLGVFTGIMASRALAGVPRLVSIGSNTMPIYLAHTPVIILTAYAVSLLATVVPFGATAWLLPPIVAAFAITVSLLLSNAAQKPPLALLYRPPGRGVARVS